MATSSSLLSRNWVKASARAARISEPRAFMRSGRLRRMIITPFSDSVSTIAIVFSSQLEAGHIPRGCDVDARALPHDHACERFGRLPGCLGEHRQHTAAVRLKGGMIPSRDTTG